MLKRLLKAVLQNSPILTPNKQLDAQRFFEFRVQSEVHLLKIVQNILLLSPDLFKNASGDALPHFFLGVGRKSQPYVHH